MITLTAKVNILGSSDIGTLDYASINRSGINVSADMSSMVGAKAKTNVSPFILGQSILGQSNTYASNVGFYIGDRLASTDNQFYDENGNQLTYTIELQGVDLSGVVVSFDDTHNQHPQSIVVDGETVAVNNATTFVNLNYMPTITSDIVFPAIDKYVSFSGHEGDDIENPIYVYTASATTTYDDFADYEICVINGIEVGEDFTTIASKGNVLKGQSSYEARFKDGELTLRSNGKIEKFEQEITQIKVSTLSLTATFYSTLHTIEIANWNTINAPLVISGLYTELSYTVDSRNMSDINIETSSVGDTETPYYGVFSNTGEINFIDTTDEVRTYAENLLLKSGLSVEIFVNNTVTQAQKRVAVYSTSDWNYKTYNKNVTVTLHDNLEDWQDIYVAGFNYDYLKKTTWTAKQFYEYLYEQTPSKYNMQTYSQLDTETQNHLAEIIVQYPYLESGTLWQQWDKLCNLAQLHIYSSGNIIYCKYRGGE